MFFVCIWRFSTEWCTYRGRLFSCLRRKRNICEFYAPNFCMVVEVEPITTVSCKQKGVKIFIPGYICGLMLSDLLRYAHMCLPLHCSDMPSSTGHFPGFRLFCCNTTVSL